MANKAFKRGHGITERWDIYTDEEIPEPPDGWGFKETAELCLYIAESTLENSGDGPFDEDSPEHLAEQIMFFYEDTIRFIEKGDADWAAIAALNMGDAYKTLLIKKEWEEDALRGRKSHESARQGGLSVRKWPQRSEELQAAVDEVYARHPEWNSYERIKSQVIKDYAEKEDTKGLRAALKRYTTNPIKS